MRRCVCACRRSRGTRSASRCAYRMSDMFGKRLWGRWLAGSLCTSALLLTGCGDFFTKDTGGGGGGGGGTVGSYTYVGTQSGLLSGYSVSSTGALATLSGSPFQFSTAAINGLAVTPA